MAINVDQLTRVQTKEEVLATLLAQLESLGFPARSWHPGGVRRTMLEVFAQALANATLVVRDIGLGGFNDTAERDWLTLFSLSHYRNARKPAVRTEGYVRITSSANAAAPASFGAGDVVFVARSGQTYRNVDPFTIEASDQVDVRVRAEAAGSSGDVAAGTIDRMQTPVAGVSVTNEVPLDRESWIAINGADEESDASLRERNRTKWATRSASTLPAMGYAYYALEASASVRRAFVDDDNPRGPGTIDIYLAGDHGPVASTVASAVEDYLYGRTPDGIVRVGMGAKVAVKSAERLQLPIRGTAYVASAYNTTATQRAVVDAVKGYFRDLPIGGSRVGTSDAGRVVFGELYRAVLSVAGVRNVAFTSPAEDLVLKPHQVVVPATMLRYVGV